MADPVRADLFKAALRRFASGVAVVTCRVDQVDHAMTATAFSAVSLDPPLVLVCVNRRSRFAEALAHTDRWGVGILDEAADSAARWFAMSGRPLVGQLDRVEHHRAAGEVALLDDALARLTCRTHEVVTAGDHDIVIGAVETADVSSARLPLLYWDGAYRRLGPHAGASGRPTA